jgi:1,4-dihydroxy-2-naphthoate octaprenyltransferase
MAEFKYLVGPARPSFLLLTPACVALGWGTAVYTNHHIEIFEIILVLVGALCAHIAVNAFNEYFDFKSGLDFVTKRTPFSGGSGSLPARPELAGFTLITATISLAIVLIIGIYFLVVRGPQILLFSLGGSAIILAYSLYFVKKPLGCLVAPGLGFGTLMVTGTHFALTGELSLTPLIISMVPFFLVSNLLLLNQFPDVEPDRQFGRSHYPIVIGRKASSLIYGTFLLLSYISIIIGILCGVLPVGTALGCVTLLFAVPAFIGAYRYADDQKKLVPFMGLNVVINILTPLLITAGLFLG